MEAQNFGKRKQKKKKKKFHDTLRDWFQMYNF